MAEMRRALVFILVIAAVSVFIISTMFISMQRSIREIRITSSEFTYAVGGGPPEIRLKVGEEIRIVFENRGNHDHEFLLVRNLDEAVNAVKQALENGMSDAELDRLKAGLAFMGVRYEVEPGSVTIFRLSISSPGVYYFICLETEPGEEPHAEKGEVGRIVVE